MSKSSEKDNCLEAADLLRRSKSEILTNWEKRVRAEISAATNMPKLSLVNSLPVFLDQLVLTLSNKYSRSQADINAEVASKHGEERAVVTDYSIDQVLFEYQILREVLMIALQENDIVRFPATEIIHGFLDRGMRKATSAFALLRAQTESKFRTIADAMPQMVWSTLPDGFHDYYNQQWYDFTGTAYGSTDGEGWNDMFHPEDQERSLETGEPYEIEYRLRDKNGVYHWTLGRALPIKDESGKIVRWMGTCTNIQELKTATGKLSESLDELHIERELRTKFVATLTHDLRTPLTAAKMAAQLILRNSKGQEKIESLAGKIVESTSRADNMIRDLLDANRLRAGEQLPINPEQCDLAFIVNETVSELITVHGDRIIYRGPDSVKGLWDCSALRRMMENLISNSIKYGGKTTPVTVNVASSKKEVMISVHNFGNPINEEDQKLMFNIYQRVHAKSDEKGWGIGLTLVKGVVEAHNGTIDLRSSHDEGTTFTVTLPFQ